MVTPSSAGIPGGILADARCPELVLESRSIFLGAEMTSDEFFKRFVPLKVCIGIPVSGGDWSCIMWTTIGISCISWWAGDPIPRTLTEGFIVTLPPRDDNLE